jgi:hypothetical protein
MTEFKQMNRYLLFAPLLMSMLLSAQSPTIPRFTKLEKN